MENGAADNRSCKEKHSAFDQVKVELSADRK